MLIVMAGIGMFAGWLTAAVITYVMPRKFESSTIIEIKPPASLGVEAMGQPTGGNYPGTEVEIIKTRNVLMRAAESLDLSSLWAIDPESAVQVLKGIVRAENIRETDLVRISVRHTDRDDARDIAAEVARAYKGYREELEYESIDRGISEIRKITREHWDKVEERRKTLTIIARNKDKEDEGYSISAQDYTDAKRDFETDLALLEQLKLKISEEEFKLATLRDVIVVHEDPVIANAPISPNVTKNLLIGLAAGLLASPFLALPLMSLMQRRNGVAT